MSDSLLSIGILAHNESPRISKTLESLFAQDVFEQFSVEVVIVANGCADDTAAVARLILASHRATWSAHGSARVVEVAIAGKANAWNQFVHEFSSPDVTILVLMDADISLMKTNTVSSMIATLEREPEAAVCVDRPIKDIETFATRTLFQRLLIAATPKIDVNNVPLCGQLYCVRSALARQITLPVEIVCEDGFLRALLLTKGFSAPEDPRRIVLDATATHSFTSVGTLWELFKHERWLVAGTIIDMLLFERFWAECGPNRTAMSLMSEWQAKDPDWLPHYIESQVRVKGWRLLPGHWWTRRWSRLRHLSFRQKFLKLPTTFAAAAVDALIFVAAIKEVHRGRAFRYWGRK